jgi:hypothetical protein
MRLRHGRPLVALLVMTLVLSACGLLPGGDDPRPTPPAQGAGQDGDPFALKGVCPDPIVIQTDWNPEAEYAGTYNLIGPGYQVDKQRQRVRGPLVVDGKDTGVTIEVRSGGPAVKFAPVADLMYQDKSITLGYMNTDQQAGFYSQRPTLAVVAQMDISPFGFMWDPAGHPEFNTLVDVGQTDTPVLYVGQVQTQMDYLTGTGILRASQIKDTYDGSPKQFLQSGGQLVQQGFVTAEPWLYEKAIEGWKQPVQFVLLHDTGYETYSQTLAIRTGDKDKLAPCLRKLVPLVQRSLASYAASPDRANQLIVDIVERYDNGFWTYPLPLARFSWEQQKALGILANGQAGDPTVGDFDLPRVRGLLEILLPIYAGQKKPLREGLRAEDLVTNEFIDPEIGIRTDQ